jgi:glycosyltransferase involved in cell wall biosynthesis
MQIGFLTYDLQPFTEDCLYRISQTIKPMLLKAYPIISHPHQNKARILSLPTRQKEKHFGVNRRGSTQEGLIYNINWHAAWRCALESDVVVLFGLQGGTALVTASLSSLMRRKIISVNQTLPVAWEVQRRWWIRWLKIWLLNRCELHIYQTPASKEVLTQVYDIKDERLFYAPFEAGASWFKQYLDKNIPREDTVRQKLGIQKNVTLFLFVGTLFPFKGITDLIQAISLVPKHEDLFCLFVGPEVPSSKIGGTITYFNEYAKHCGVQNSVCFLGSLHPAKLAEIYLAADAVVLPTHKDCFPKVLVEGALAAKPLVTTYACGAIGSIVIDDYNGFIIQPGDIDALSKSMMKLFNKTLRIEMGKRSLELVHSFCDTERETEGFCNAIQHAKNGLNTGRK